ncbi:tlde1 domain-containing protein [Rouxiella aceris]|jgi:hypothetical protein|nr:tlde1 domain-containing protein [Rouxiella aceris]
MAPRAPLLLQRSDSMSWVYEVNKKAFYLNGEFKFYAMYAGAPDYKDDSKFECLLNKGPLPRGKYTISGKQQRHRTAGVYVLVLAPYSTNKMCGRAGFLIHGDNGKGTASEGCIVADRAYREFIWESKDRELIVK